MSTTSDFASSLMDHLVNSDKFASVICEDCDYNCSYGEDYCPTCGDMFDSDCPNHNLASSFIDDIEAVCRSYGFTN